MCARVCNENRQYAKPCIMLTLTRSFQSNGIHVIESPFGADAAAAAAAAVKDVSHRKL